MSVRIVLAMSLVCVTARAQDAAHGGGAHGGGAVELAESRPSASLAPGTVRVTVLTPEGTPVPGATVRLGTMGQGGTRDSMMRESDASGVATFADLPTGSSQAYRANVHYQGATYSSTPFRLEPDRGQEVRIRQLPVSHDESLILQALGQTMLEYRDERIHVSQQARLMNLGDATYLFPEAGVRFRLPRGFIAFQSEAVMSDQRVTPDDDGFVVRGSLPPGEVTLNWAFDLPLSSGTMVVSQPMPLRTFSYRVISDAADGMTLDVEGFPETERHEVQGREYFVTQLQRRAGDESLDRVHITISGVPGPGPLRWIAVGAALMLTLLGLLMAFRGGDLSGALAEARKRRQSELLSDVDELERLFTSGDIGPQYRERRIREITDELASLLRLDAAAKAAASSPTRG